MLYQRRSKKEKKKDLVWKSVIDWIRSGDFQYPYEVKIWQLLKSFIEFLLRRYTKRNSYTLPRTQIDIPDGKEMSITMTASLWILVLPIFFLIRAIDTNSNRWDGLPWNNSLNFVLFAEQKECLLRDINIKTFIRRSNRCLWREEAMTTLWIRVNRRAYDGRAMLRNWSLCFYHNIFGNLWASILRRGSCWKPIRKHKMRRTLWRGKRYLTYPLEIARHEFCFNDAPGFRTDAVAGDGRFRTALQPKKNPLVEKWRAI